MLTGLCCLAQPQNQAAPADRQPYLLRIGRIEYQVRACVLLKRDGNYHLEHDSGDKAEVFEGTLSAAELERLQGFLDDERLQKLSREQIVQPLAAEDPEKWQFNIFRGDHWQDLPFESGDSMRPFHEFLAPVIDWFNDLHKEPHQTIPENEGKTNCLPPRKIAFSVRHEEPTPAAGTGAKAETSGTASAPQPAPAYVMRLINQYGDRGEIDSVCSIVYPDGSYRLERSSQDWGGKMRTKVYEAKLKDKEFERIRRLLEDPKLKAIVSKEPPDELLQHFETGGGRNVPDMFGFTLAWIPRTDTVQGLTILHGVWVPSAIGSHNIISSQNETRVRPLEHWVRALPAGNSQLLKDGVPNKCAPK